MSIWMSKTWSEVILLRRVPRPTEKYQKTFYIDIPNNKVWSEGKKGEKDMVGTLDDLLLYVINLSDQEFYPVEYIKISMKKEINYGK